jgi:ectoine hydroxylase-related dioxygenase (phytanoyl-CoA dioxygenase family)
MEKPHRLRILTLEQVQRYEREGVLFPVPVLAADDLMRFGSALEDLVAHLGGHLKRLDQCHLFFRWAYDLALHSAVLDVVEDLIGPDILVHSSRIFYKHPHDPAYVSWHQDGRYSGLNAYPATTAWIALSDSTAENGCLQVLSGSHQHGVHPHIEGEARDNLVNHGQKVTIEIDEAQVRNVVLTAGAMSLHHINLIHGSQPNRSGTKRIGFSVSYIPPEVKHSALPVVRARGRADYDHFEFLKEPPRDSGEACLAAHAEFLYQRQVLRDRVE